MKCKYNFIVVVLFLLQSCSAVRKTTSDPAISSLKLLGGYEVPYGYTFQETTVGGLSGIDYDSTSGLYYMICDDRSAINPARFYTARISFTEKGINEVSFVDVVTLLSKKGTVFPSVKQDPAHTPDPEAMRYNAHAGTLVWSSEGERIVQKDKTILADPFVAVAGRNGQWLDSFPIPPLLHMRATENGPRRNGVFEGLTFSNNNKSLYVSIEEPLYEDGPRAGLKDTATWTRIIKYDVASKKVTGQYAYYLSPVAKAPVPADGFMVNGIPDILSLGNDQFIVVERSYSVGYDNCTILVYWVDLSKAQNINKIASLRAHPTKSTATKKLLLNMDSLGIFIDNIEGVTFGPTLPNGHRTLLFVSDNNFSPTQKTQFLLFEVM